MDELWANIQRLSGSSIPLRSKKHIFVRNVESETATIIIENGSRFTVYRDDVNEVFAAIPVQQLNVSKARQVFIANENGRGDRVVSYIVALIDAGANRTD